MDINSLAQIFKMRIAHYMNFIDGHLGLDIIQNIEYLLMDRVSSRGILVNFFISLAKDLKTLFHNFLHHETSERKYL